MSYLIKEHDQRMSLWVFIEHLRIADSYLIMNSKVSRKSVNLECAFAQII